MLELLSIFCDFARDRRLAQDAFIVGGTVRDFLLDRKIKDTDVVVKGNAEAIGSSFADAAGASFVLLDRDFGIARVARDNEFIDVCTMHGCSILDDLANRDLTINSMAIPMEKVSSEALNAANSDFKQIKKQMEDIIIDPFNGQHDLKYSIIRMISEANLVNDPLRLLRVYRFAAELNFSVEANTASAVRVHAPMIATPAVERISEEFRHIVLSASSYSTIIDMEKVGLMFALFPVLAEIPTAIWHQTRQSYGYIEHILNNLSLYFPGRSIPMQNYFADRTITFCLKFSILFKDSIATDKTAHRLRLSRRENAFLRMLHAKHDVIASLGDNWKPIIIATLKELGDNIYALLVYALAVGHICQLSPNHMASMVKEIIAVYQDEFIPRLSRLPLVNGYDLISEFGLSPSPFFKELLSTIEQLALEGQITSRGDALAETGRMVRKKEIG